MAYYKTILVHVDQSSQAPERIGVALRLALDEQAHLVGVAATGLSRFAYVGTAYDPSPWLFQLEQMRAAAARALDAFEAQARQSGLVSYERRLVEDEAGPALAEQARYADLLVLGQSDRAALAPGVRADFPEYVVVNAERPVLMVPATGRHAQPGRKVLVAWNGSQQALRALTSALPLLQRAEDVVLIVFDAVRDGDHGEQPGADIGLWLARHGVRVEVAQYSASDHADVADALLEQACQRGSDLIVMGAYGHARLREIFLGGTTRSMLASMTVPLWLAH